MKNIPVSNRIVKVTGCKILQKTALTVKIDSNLNKEFRKIIIEKYGVKRGSISQSIEEAIELWVKESSQALPEEPIAMT